MTGPLANTPIKGARIAEINQKGAMRSRPKAMCRLAKVAVEANPSGASIATISM
jgi:hypothetical protein